MNLAVTGREGAPSWALKPKPCHLFTVSTTSYIVDLQVLDLYNGCHVPICHLVFNKVGHLESFVDCKETQNIPTCVEDILG